QSARGCAIRRRLVRSASISAGSSIRFRGCSSTASCRRGAGACTSASGRLSDACRGWGLGASRRREGKGQGTRHMRIVRRLLHVLILVLTLVVGAAAAAVIVSQTAWFKNWLRGFIVAQANQYLNGTLSIERLGGDLFLGVELENIGVSMDGSEVVAVQDLGLKYNAFSLISRGLSIDEIRLDKPVVYLRREGDTWQLSRLVKKEETEATRSGPAKPLSIDAIEIADGAGAIDSPVATSSLQV